MQKRIASVYFLIPLVLASCGDAGTPTIEYTYTDVEGDKIKVLYSDEYFDTPSNEADIRLAHLSMCIDFLSDRDLSDVPPTETSHIQKFYEAIGFSNCYFSPSYYQPTTLTSCAYSFASKKLVNGESAVIVSVCSGGYKNEWAANFNLGLEGDAAGFIDPAKNVLDALKDYVRGYVSGPTNLFLAGYSRGGAILDLACGMIDDEIYGKPASWGQAEISWENTYCYAFETPAGSIRTDYADAKFDNIHNYFNINDIIPLLAPSTWGFHALGQKHYLSDRLTDIRYPQRRDAFLKALKDVAPKGTKYPIDTWRTADSSIEANPSLSRAERSYLVGKIAEWIGDRTTYVNEYQESVKWIFLFYYGSEDGEYLVKTVKANLIGLFFRLDDLKSALALIQEHDYPAAEAKILEVFDAVISDEGRTHAILEEAFPHVEPLFGIIASAYSEEGSASITDIVNYLTASVFGHLRVSIANWMAAVDSRYGYGGDDTWINDGTYYRLAVPEVSSFTLSLEDGTRLLSYGNGKFGDTALSAEIKDGELSVYLPKNASYQYEGGSENNLSLFDVNADCEEKLIRSNMPASGTI